MNEHVKKAVEYFKLKMLENGVPLKSLTLFGSQARGDAAEDSDIDVLVEVEHEDPEMQRKISHFAWEAGFEAGLLIQSIVMTTDDLTRGPEKSSMFVRAVRREGITI